ncbi:MAG: hypothetical protein IJB74_06865 [Clostridia bacterium]|nr:hypothetical protein [Clostridia bacterium]
MKKNIVILIVSSLVMDISGALCYAMFDEIELWKSIIIYLITLISFVVNFYIILKFLERRIKKKILDVIFYLVVLSNIIGAFIFFLIQGTGL